MRAYQRLTMSLLVAGLAGATAALADMAQGRFFDVVAVVSFYLAGVVFVGAVGFGAFVVATLRHDETVREVLRRHLG